MDLNAIKSRLTSLNEEAKPKEKREKKDFNSASTVKYVKVSLD